MRQEQANARRRAFSIWLRTGRMRPLHMDKGIEFKFNPWHDPENGRFTFVGTGRYYPRGGGQSKGQADQNRASVEYVYDPTLPRIRSMEEAEVWRAAELAKHGHKPAYRKAIEEQYQRYKVAFARLSEAQVKPDLGAMPSDARAPERESQGGFEPVPVSTEEFRGGGGDFGGGGDHDGWDGPNGGFEGGGGSVGGGGASGNWDTSDKQPHRSSETADIGMSSVQRERATANMDQREAPRRRDSDSGLWRQVERNGYLYEVDQHNRTRRISGDITLNPKQARSPSTQRAAGGEDRRPSDHGGHYVARRFNGPTDAFNHFAQDASFNRRDYAKLENQWERAKRQGKQVRVKIVPVYEGRSQRPSSLNVWFWIDGQRESQNFPNESKGEQNGK